MADPCGCQHERHVRDLKAQIENLYRVHELDMQQVEQHCQRVKQLEGELHRIRQWLLASNLHVELVERTLRQIDGSLSGKSSDV